VVDSSVMVSSSLGLTWITREVDMIGCLIYVNNVRSTGNFFLRTVFSFPLF